MIIVRVAGSESNIMVVRLPHANMTIDPRPICWTHHEFRFSVNGKTLTVTRIVQDEDEGWNDEFFVCAHLQTDTIPDFASTIYTYWGLKDERAPKDVTEVNFHRPLLPSRNVLSIVVNPWCGLQYRIL